MDISTRQALRVVDFLEKVADFSFRSCDILIHLCSIYDFVNPFPVSFFNIGRYKIKGLCS